jgi:hypothetical protein
MQMAQYNGLNPEERARIAEIQDSLIDLYVEQKEAFEKGGATEIEFETKELRREMEKIKVLANVWSALPANQRADALLRLIVQ